MAYVNVGAYVNGKRPASKRALRDALREDPSSVTFDGTSLIGASGTYTGDAIPEGITLSVVGPDPYRSRKFYASVSVGPKGLRIQ